MNSKNVLNENFCYSFGRRVFVFRCVKSVVTLFRELVNYCTNRVVIVKVRELCDEIYGHVLPSFGERGKKYKKIIVAII